MFFHFSPLDIPSLLSSFRSAMLSLNPTCRRIKQPHLRQSCVRSPRAWTWRPWDPGSNPSTVPSIRQRSSDSCRKRTTPWIEPTPNNMATAAPRSGRNTHERCTNERFMKSDQIVVCCCASNILFRCATKKKTLFCLFLSWETSRGGSRPVQQEEEPLERLWLRPT